MHRHQTTCKLTFFLIYVAVIVTWLTQYIKGQNVQAERTDDDL